MAYSAFTQDDLRSQAGSLALAMLDVADRITIYKAFLDATPDATMTATGMSQVEVTNIKSAFADLAAVVAALRGTAAAAQADRTVFARRLIGPLTY